MIRPKTSYIIYLLPALFYLTDFLIRWKFLSLIDSKGILNFSISIIFELAFYISIFFLISRTSYQKLLSISFGLMIALLQLIVYSHYLYFGVLPNNYSLWFLANQFVNTISLLLNSIEWWHFIVLVFLTIFYGLIILKSVRKITNWKFRKGLVLIIPSFVVILFFNNNVKFYTQSYSVTPATFFAIKYFTSELFFGKSILGNRGFIQRHFDIEDKIIIPPKYNVLILLSESLRKKNLHCYGYERETTPFLDSLLKENKLIKFENHTSNAVSTQFSVPIMMSGIFSFRKVNTPYLQDFSKHWFGTTNFLISSQLMARNSIEKVYNTSFDTFICQERSGLPIYNDMAFNDNELLPTFKNELSKIKKNKFFGIIGFNNTHYPYTTSAMSNLEFNPSTLRSVNAYDNTILEQDEIIKKIFITLEQNKLLDSTIIIFTSDHGEAFGEHNHSGHLKSLYEEEINIPLLIYTPTSFPKKLKERLMQNIYTNTSHLDIFPTVLEFLGNSDSIKLKYLQTGNSLLQPINKQRNIPMFVLDISNSEGLIEGNFKYIETKDGSHISQELFNTKSDPKELNNLWKKLTQKEKSDWINKLEKIRIARLTIDNEN